MAENFEKKSIDLGFAEECDNYLLTNTYFPSKVGGRPAWLDLTNLPHPNGIKCGNCNEPCIFLCQIYASLDTSPNCFHRTIYVFICKNEECCQPNKAKNLIVLRSQLSRDNQFYSFTPPQEDIELPETKPSVSLCSFCGCRGPFNCGKCKLISYCGTTHQRLDWTTHKLTCGKNLPESKNKDSKFLFPQYEIVLETEEDPTNILKETDEQAEQRRLADYEKLLESGKTGDLKDIPESELMKFTNKEDKTFLKFKKTIQNEPKQILRYERKGSPLWITSHNTLSDTAVPNCENCNGLRVFEFQIMPQLLNYIKNDSLDWGTIVIYTCENSCDTKSEYFREYAYKQDLLKDE